MTFENINASGLGLAIGSIGGSTVRNITFRNAYVHKSVKGIYLKFHEPEQYWIDNNLTNGVIENVTFENVLIESPTQWPIWIGPAQQADARNPCKANPCSLCWPMTPTSQCNVVTTSKLRNVTLSNVRINLPHYSPGVLLSSDDNPMENIEFHNVRVTKNKVSPSYANNLLETFPGLKQPIHDRYVPSSRGGSDDYSYRFGGGGRASSNSDDDDHDDQRIARMAFSSVVFSGGGIDVLPYDDDIGGDDDDESTEQEELLKRKKFSAVAIGLIVGSSILGALLIVSIVHYLWQWKRMHDARIRRVQQHQQHHNHQDQQSQQQQHERPQQGGESRRVRFHDLVEVKDDEGNNQSVDGNSSTIRVPLMDAASSSTSTAVLSSPFTDGDREDSGGEELRFTTTFHINLYHWLAVLVVSLAISVTYMILRWPFRPDWYRTDRYYKVRLYGSSFVTPLFLCGFT